jgi:hypothetical protein
MPILETFCFGRVSGEAAELKLLATPKTITEVLRAPNANNSSGNRASSRFTSRMSCHLAFLEPSCQYYDRYVRSQPMATPTRPQVRFRNGQFAAVHPPLGVPSATQQSGTTQPHAQTPNVSTRRRSYRHSSHEVTDETQEPLIDPDPLQSSEVRSSRFRKRPATRGSSQEARPAPARSATPPLSNSPQRSRRRPPNNLTVAQPNGPVLETVNGVQRELGIRDSDVRSKVDAAQSSTKDPKHSNNAKRTGNPAIARVKAITTTSTSDKRSLRSHDGGSRLKSDLAIYFANYDDVITNAPKKPGELSTAFSHDQCMLTTLFRIFGS